MQLALDRRMRRIVRRLPHITIYSALEIALLTALAIQCARLFWVILTPIGPLGDWRGDDGIARLAPPQITLFEQFDPFFRIEGGGPIIVTELDIQLFGVRQDRASGRGSAIIALPGGEQSSFLVGDELIPGVVLEAVGFDFITINRNGQREQLFLDQSSSPVPQSAVGATAPSSAPTVQPPTSTSASPAPRGPITAHQLARGTQISPRREGNRLTGIIVQPTDSGETLAAAGFHPGDVITAINGQQVENMDQAAQFATMLGAGNAQVEVERNGETVTFRARVSQ